MTVAPPAATPDAVARWFRARLDRSPVVGARAPGRVNLIGEHTDYNEGLVLPCALGLETVVALAPRDDRRMRLLSRDVPLTEPADDAMAGAPFAGERGPAGARAGDRAQVPGRAPGAGPGGWRDYVAGVVRALGERGIDVPGFDLAVASDVPIGAGLSSSAALQVAVVTALDRALALGLSARERARVAHRSERAFVGVRCGILDPFACALCEPGAALRIDCRDERVRAVPLPAGRLALLLTDSGAPRALVAGAYNARVAECRRALDTARAAGIAPPDATSLRALGFADLSRLERALDAVALRRARHVITENERVEAFEAALARCAAGDADALRDAGALLGASQRSLRDDYEVSTPQLDALCELAAAHGAAFGSRLTGAGFGGCVLHLVEPAAAHDAEAAIAAGFAQRFGRRPRSWIVRPGRGASAFDC